QPGLLHRVRRVASRAEDAPGDLLQSLAVILEALGHPGLLVHRSPFSHAVRQSSDGADPTDVTGMNPGVLLRPIGDTTMQARMRSRVEVLREALKALHALDRSSEGLPYVTRKMVLLRASQINGCSVCVDMHARELKKAGQSDERIFAVAAWRDTPWFNEAERAALALTEAVTRLADRPDPVPDEIWDEAAKHYDQPALAALLVQIAEINVWNRLNVAVRQVAGRWG